jgi:hypothetical protein
MDALRHGDRFGLVYLGSCKNAEISRRVKRIAYTARRPDVD